MYVCMDEWMGKLVYTDNALIVQSKKIILLQNATET